MFEIKFLQHVYLQRVLSGVTGINFYYHYMGPTTFLTIYFIGFAWVLTFLGLFVYGGFTFSRGEVAYLWPLRLLRSIGNVSATVLYIPLCSLLLSSWSCGGADVHHWTDAGFTCNSGGHLALAIIATLLTAVFFGLSAVFSLIMIDSAPLSPALAAKSSGNVDLLLLVIKTVLVIVGHVANETLGSPWVIIAINAAAALCWIGLSVAFTPYRNHRMQELTMGAGTTYLFIAVCAALTQVGLLTGHTRHPSTCSNRVP